MDPAELKQITTAIENGFKSMGAGSSAFNAPQTPGSGGLGDMIKALLDPAKAAIAGAVDITSRAANNSLQLGDAAQALKGVFDTLGAPGQLVGSTFGLIAGVVVESIDNWRKFSHEGLNFAGNAIAFREAVMKTGMTYSEFGDTLEKIKPAMFLFGGGLTAGMEGFGRVSNMMNSPVLQSALNTMGILPKEANEILALQIRMGRTNLDANNPAKMAAVVESAVNLATEMDAMAKLTGISRREQQKNIETMENDVRVRARLALLNADPAMRESIGNVQKAGSGLPQEVGKVLMESVAGKGIITSEKLSELTLTYGQRAANQIAEIGRLANSNDKAERDRAAEMTRNLFSVLAQDRKLNAEYVARGVNTSQMALEAFQNDYFNNYEETVGRIQTEMGVTREAAEKEAGARMRALAKGYLIEDMDVIIDGKKEKIRAARSASGEYETKDPRSMGTQLVADAQGVLRTVGNEANKVITAANNAIPTYTKNAQTGVLELSEESKKLQMQAKQAVQDDGKNWQSNIPAMFKDVHDLFKTTNVTMTDLPTKLATAMEVVFKKLFPGRAVGGDVTAGMPYVVGEVGAEMFMPKVDGFIQNNLSTAGLGSANLSSILKNIPAIVSSGSQQVEQAVTQMASAMPDSNLLADKLDRLSSIMESVARSTQNTENYTGQTAKNTREIGGIVA